MKAQTTRIRMRWILAMCLSIVCATVPVCAKASDATSIKHESVRQLASQLRVGDVVFIRLKPYPLTKVASATRSWTNHVGVVVDVSGIEPVIAESAIPFSRNTTLSRFVARSENGRIGISRLEHPLTDMQRKGVQLSSHQRLGIYYDTGFNLYSSGQFCSRFVHEILYEATGVSVGKPETLKELLDKNPEADIAFWRMWYFGRIPWERKTITPASLWQSAQLHSVFDGYAT